MLAGQPSSALRVVLVFGLLWWMHGGYAWLTNALPPERTVHRLLVLLGMAGFLVIALALPKAFDDTAVVAGLAAATAVVGMWTSAAWQLAVLAGLLVGLLVAERRR